MEPGPAQPARCASAASASTTKADAGLQERPELDPATCGAIDGIRGHVLHELAEVLGHARLVELSGDPRLGASSTRC